MSNEINLKAESGPRVYQIRIKGHVCCAWADWFGGMSITLEASGDTLLSGSLIDQAALHGVLRNVRDLGMPLLSVTSVEACDHPADDRTLQADEARQGKQR